MNNLPTASELQFSKQFLLAPKRFSHELLKDWTLQPVNNNYALYSHKKLSVANSSGSNTSLWGLGMFLDPCDTEADDKTIIQRLATSSLNFSELESNIAMLGGRWVLIAIIDNDVRIYHDATGQKPVFLYPKQAEEIYISSHPSLLHALEVTEYDIELVKNFEQYKNSGREFRGTPVYVPN